MSSTVVITTSALNRKGFRMLSEGGDVEQYKKNPVLLFMHQRPWRGSQDEVLPIGTVKNIRLEGDAWKGELEFDTDDAFAARVAAKWDKGIYRMVSPGITPIDFSEDAKLMVPGQRYATLVKWRLDEVSVVDIGANDDAIAVKNAQTGKYITLNDGADLSFLPLINKNQDQMKNIALKLGLAEDATEEMVIQAIESKDAELVRLNADAARVRLEAITNLVDSAITEKRITQKQRDHFVQLGTDVGTEMLKTTLAAIEPAVKPMDVIAARGQGSPDEQKKLADYGPQELEKLRAEDPGAYALVYKNEYGFEPSLK